MQRQHFPRCATALCGLALFLWTTPLLAHGFLPVVEGLPPTTAHIVTVDGRVFIGHLEGELQGVHGSFEVDLRTEDGVVLRFTADDVREIFLPLEGLLLPVVHTAMVLESATTLEKALRTDYPAIRELEAMHFDAVRWPGRSQHMILQRVNPGFDQGIRVYALRNAQEGVHFFDDVPLFGDQQKVFVAVKDGEAFPIHKWSYGEEFALLFGDCPAMLAEVPPRQRKFNRFADHVWAYQQNCVDPATPLYAEKATRGPEASTTSSP